MKFYKNKENIYAYEECFDNILILKNKEWDKVFMAKSELFKFKEISKQEVMDVTKKDPIIEIDKLFSGLSCSEEF